MVLTGSRRRDTFIPYLLWLDTPPGVLSHLILRNNVESGHYRARFFWRETESEKLSEACEGGCGKWQADEEKMCSVIQVKLQEAKPYCQHLSRRLSCPETDVS